MTEAWLFLRLALATGVVLVPASSSRARSG